MKILAETKKPLAHPVYDARLARFQQRLDTDWNNPEDRMLPLATQRLPEIFAALGEIIDAVNRGEPEICPVDEDISVTWRLHIRCVIDICPITLDTVIRLAGPDRRTTREAELNLLDPNILSQVEKALESAESH